MRKRGGRAKQRCCRPPRLVCRHTAPGKGGASPPPGRHRAQVPDRHESSKRLRHAPQGQHVGRRQRRTQHQGGDTQPGALLRHYRHVTHRVEVADEQVAHRLPQVEGGKQPQKQSRISLSQPRQPQQTSAGQRPQQIGRHAAIGRCGALSRRQRPIALRVHRTGGGVKEVGLHLHLKPPVLAAKCAVQHRVPHLVQPDHRVQRPVAQRRPYQPSNHVSSLRCAP